MHRRSRARQRLARVAGIILAACAFLADRGVAAAPSGAVIPAAGRPVDVVQFGHAMGPGFGINAVAWMPQGPYALTLGQDGRLISWNTDKAWVIGRPGAPAFHVVGPDGDGGWLQSSIVRVSPDGHHAAIVTGAEDGAFETEINDLDARRGLGWLHALPRLWIGAGRSRLIVGPAGDCSGEGCGLSIVDPDGVRDGVVAQAPLGPGFGDGRMMSASSDGMRFAAVVAGPTGERHLVVWASDDLKALARFDVGPEAVREIGFDAAGRRVFARSAERLTIHDLATGLTTSRRLKPPASGSDGRGLTILTTDIDARTMILAAPAARDGETVAQLYGFGSGRLGAKATGVLAAVFPRKGAVLVDPSDGTGVYLDAVGGVSAPLGRGIARPLESPASWSRGEWRPASAGPLLDLSADGGKLLSADGWWEPIGRPAERVALTGFQVLNAARIWLSPDGRRFAFLLPAAGHSGLSAWIFDLDAGRLYRVYDGNAGGRGGWLSDDRFALVGVDGHAVAISARTGEVTALATTPSGMSDGDRSPDEEPDLSCTPAPTGHSVAGAAQMGYSRATCVYWQLMGSGALSFTSTRDWKTLFVLYLHPDGTWLVQGRGRYDTNRPADTSDLRYLVPDQPWVSLPGQTYMRDFYQPRLMERLLDCNGANSCATTLKPLPDISALDWVLPKVRIVGMAPVSGTNSVSVDVEAVEGEDQAAPEGRRTSEVHDLRLFRDGKLVGQWPTPRPPSPGASAADLLRTWRADTAVPGTSGGATVTHPFVVDLPTAAGVGKVTFSAYAFNRDRVKGETDTADYALAAAVARRPRRAYVIAIGVDSYPAIPDHALRFAVNDAVAISRSMKRFLAISDRADPAEPYSVVSITLISDGTVDQATKADIHAVLDLLAGVSPAAARATLARAGVDAGGLAKAEPDDLVVAAFSGHGWANPVGDFYLLPSDAIRPATDHAETLASLISSAELTDWLREVDAGEMALIIDACHSAASVAADGFKPGPMGDPGLGQLAYDKGIRILAATQADDVAQESEDLGGGHGLLTYVLVDRGLADPRAGGVPRDANGGVRIDALLNYVVAKVPALAETLQAPPAWETAGWKPMLAPRDPPPAEPPRLQQPVLFDFTGKPSPAAIKPSAPGSTKAPA